MNASSPTLRRLAGAFAAIAAAAVLAAPAALGDPPNYPRYMPAEQVAAVHVPEIVAGLGSPGGTVLASPPATRTASSGFSWTDAGIGAGIALAAAAFASGCAVALRKRVSLAH
ncbi:MAG TPA: hypothetical protein VKB73_15595 [Gaiellaceae bacterium]|nr:hypothetical protein [Gaiellaceae bacterium]